MAIRIRRYASHLCTRSTSVPSSMGATEKIMIAINQLTSTAAPLDISNIDTDQIIPKQFLKRIERTGYGDFLFYDWRYEIQSDPNGSSATREIVKERPDFVLNKPQHKGARIL